MGAKHKKKKKLRRDFGVAVRISEVSLPFQSLSLSSDQTTFEQLPWICPGALMKSKGSNIRENACFPKHNTVVFIHIFFVFIYILF